SLGFGHRSDQNAVWREVRRQQQDLGVSSPTLAMSDTFTTVADLLGEYRRKLPYLEGCSGIAVGIGSKLASLDVFDQPATCCKLWSRLLSGYVLDTLEHRTTEAHVAQQDVVDVLRASQVASWEPVRAVGEGQEFRSALKNG